MSIYKVAHNENVTLYKIGLPPHTMHSHNMMAAAMLVRTVESLHCLDQIPIITQVQTITQGQN